MKFSPTVGKEQRGSRPAVVISGNSFNLSEMVMVCPMTSKIKLYPQDIVIEPRELNKLDKRSEVLIGQTRMVSKERVVKKIGEITQTELEQIFAGLDALLDR